MKPRIKNIINKRKNRLLFTSAAVITCLFFCLFNSSKILARSVIPLVVAPARQVIQSDPGKTISFAVRFYNTGENSISGIFKSADFIVDNKEGVPTFLDKNENLSNRYAASKWVSLNAAEGTIPPGDMFIISGKIEIPKDANPGGKYFAVFFEPSTDIGEYDGSNSGESSVSVRIAGLVYLRVSGPISEGAEARLHTPLFSEHGPVDITAEIKNKGDYHITPKGNIVIKDIFGRKIAEEALEEVNIFPDASRIITTRPGTKWMVGKFTASLIATYGESKKSLVSEAVFWVFPWKISAIIILAIVIIVLIIMIFRYKSGKKYKKIEAELEKEREELEKLKEAYKDKVASLISGTEKSENARGEVKSENPQ